MPIEVCSTTDDFAMNKGSFKKNKKKLDELIIIVFLIKFSYNNFPSNCNQ